MLGKKREKSKDIVRSTVARINQMEPLEEPIMNVVHEALIIGGRVTGMYSALDMAYVGYKVHLVERSPTIGWHMLKFDKVLLLLDCSACILTPRMVDVSKNPPI